MLFFHGTAAGAILSRFLCALKDVMPNLTAHVMPTDARENVSMNSKASLLMLLVGGDSPFPTFEMRICNSRFGIEKMLIFVPN